MSDGDGAFMRCVYMCPKCGFVSGTWRMHHTRRGPWVVMCQTGMVSASVEVESVFLLNGQEAAQQTWDALHKEGS